MGDLIPDDPIPDDPPALEPVSLQTAGPETAGSGPPAPRRFASKGSLHLRTAGTALVNWWRAVTIRGAVRCAAVADRSSVVACTAGAALGVDRRPDDPGSQLWWGYRSSGPCLLHPGEPAQHVPLVHPAGPLCGDRGHRSIAIAAAHYEAGHARARLGLHPGPDRARHCYSVLGDFAGSPFARHRLCFPPATSPVPHFPSRSVTLIDIMRFSFKENRTRGRRPASRGGKSGRHRKPPA